MCLKGVGGRPEIFTIWLRGMGSIFSSGAIWVGIVGATVALRYGEEFSDYAMDFLLVVSTFLFSLLLSAWLQVKLNRRATFFVGSMLFLQIFLIVAYGDDAWVFIGFLVGNLTLAMIMLLFLARSFDAVDWLRVPRFRHAEIRRL